MVFCLRSNVPNHRLMCSVYTVDLERFVFGTVHKAWIKALGKPGGPFLCLTQRSLWFFKEKYILTIKQHTFQKLLINLHNFIKSCPSRRFLSGLSFLKNILFFFHGQSARHLLRNEEIIVDAEEDERHDRKDDNLIQSIRSLDQNENHHDNRSDPHESPNLLSCPSESQKPMM